MSFKNFRLRVSVLIFTFAYACIGTALFGYIKSCFRPDEPARSRQILKGCSVDPISYGPAQLTIDTLPDLELDGEYQLANPTVPTAFRSIRSLRIQARWYDLKRISGALSGIVDTGGGLVADRDNKFAWFSATPGSLAFETKLTDATDYRFTGKATGWKTTTEHRTRVEITGTLYKVTNGMIVDSMYADFVHGGC